jgi:hypothetical protein
MYDVDRLLIEKKEIADRIYKNTVAQSESIVGEDVEKLLTLVESRQKLLDRVVDIDKEITKYQSSNTEKLRMLKSNIIILFKKIYELDKKNNELLSRMKEDTFDRIQQVQHSKKAMVNGYMKQNISTYGYFLDKKK